MKQKVEAGILPVHSKKQLDKYKRNKSEREKKILKNKAERRKKKEPKQLEREGDNGTRYIVGCR